MLATVHPRSFRNLADEPFAPDAGCNLLLGRNGAGKTSLLEAVYLAATTKSFRSHDLGACVRHGEEAFHLAVEAGQGGRDRLELGWRRGGRLRLANGQQLPLAEHVAVQPVVLWTAVEADLLGGAPALGRRLIDRGLVSTRPSALALLGRYRHVLEQKRQLLARGGVETLETWNALLAETGAELIALRATYVDALGRALAKVVARTPLDLPPLAVDYVPSPRAGRDGREAITEVLVRVAARERERRAPLVGPHRDTLRLLWAGREVAAVASAGEAKALGLLLAAAQGAVVEQAGSDPLYLLDDADAELDAGRLAAVWQAFAEVRQLLATSSRAEAWEGLSTSRRWVVAEGRLTPA